MKTKNLMDLGARVSRKKEFAPPITHAVAAGWAKPASPRLSEAHVCRRTFIDPTDPYAMIQRAAIDEEQLSVVA